MATLYIATHEYHMSAAAGPHLHLDHLERGRVVARVRRSCAVRQKQALVPAVIGILPSIKPKSDDPNTMLHIHT